MSTYRYFHVDLDNNRCARVKIRRGDYDSASISDRRQLIEAAVFGQTGIRDPRIVELLEMERRTE